MVGRRFAKLSNFLRAAGRAGLPATPPWWPTSGGRSVLRGRGQYGGVEGGGCTAGSDVQSVGGAVQRGIRLKVVCGVGCEFCIAFGVPYDRQTGV